MNSSKDVARMERSVIREKTVICLFPRVLASLHPGYDLYRRNKKPISKVNNTFARGKTSSDNVGWISAIARNPPNPKSVL